MTRSRGRRGCRQAARRFDLEQFPEAEIALGDYWRKALHQAIISNSREMIGIRIKSSSIFISSIHTKYQTTILVYDGILTSS
jgi:hypothetical protein